MHNTESDIGFFRRVCIDLGLDWSNPNVVDTLTLARYIFDRSQVGSFELSQLARYVGSPSCPVHRTLDNAITAVDVLCHLMERLTAYGVQTASGLVHYPPTVAPEVRAKRHLADGAPHTLGVYAFRSGDGDPLYMDIALDLWRRLLQYFDGADSRRKITEMVSQVGRVEIIEYPRGFATEIREAHLIFALRLPHDRQRTKPAHGWYIIPTSPGRPVRISRTVTDARNLDLFHTHDTATAIRDKFFAFNDDFATITAQISTTDVGEITDMVAEISAFTEAYRSQYMAVQRDRTVEFIISLDRRQRLSMLATVPSLRVIFPDGNRDWHLARIRYGRLAGASATPHSAEVNYIIELMRSSAQTVTPGDSLYKGASVNELSIIWKWLQCPGARIEPIGDKFSCPRLSIGRHLRWVIDVQQACRETRREP